MDVAMVDNVSNAAISGNVFSPVQVSDPGPPKKSESDKSAAPKESPVSSDTLKKIAESVQAQISVINSSLSFQAYGKNNDKFAIVVSDKTTGKIIREIPSKEVREMQAKLDELIGLIFNGSA